MSFTAASTELVGFNRAIAPEPTTQDTQASNAKPTLPNAAQTRFHVRSTVFTTTSPTDPSTWVGHADVSSGASSPSRKLHHDSSSDCALTPTSRCCSKLHSLAIATRPHWDLSSTTTPAGLKAPGAWRSHATSIVSQNANEEESQVSNCANVHFVSCLYLPIIHPFPHVPDALVHSIVRPFSK